MVITPSGQPVNGVYPATMVTQPVNYPNVYPATVTSTAGNFNPQQPPMPVISQTPFGNYNNYGQMTANGMNNQPVNNGLNSNLYASTFENKPNYY